MGIGRKCNCGTKDAALVWCYAHGYLIKPAPIRRVRPTSVRVAPLAATLESKPVKPTRTWHNCARCGKKFLAKRADARFCSVKCRIQECRMGRLKENEESTSVSTVVSR
jgi:hypothetical protein